MMGYEKLTAMAKAMPIVEERYLRLLPWTWAHYWMFQVAVARVAQFAAVNLELTDLAPNAYTAGLLHDYGRLLLVHLYPFSFQAIVSAAKKLSIPLEEAEQKHVDWTAREIGENFAHKHGMPKTYCEVIRWVGTPEAAGERPYMVALVTLARQLCLQNQIGFSGGNSNSLGPVEESPAWQILRARVFPSFNLRKFESQTHNLCGTLKQELAGHV
jgi:hypothetical protein